MSDASKEPLSWLLLERYALGELADDERRKVEERLRVSPEDRACLDEILHDASELPALPVVALRPRAKRRGGWLVLSTGLAAAAALMLVLWRGNDDLLPPSARRIDQGVKGGEVAIALLSERNGESPRSFVDGERFKVLVTCPPSFAAELRVLIFQAGARYEPLPRAQGFACGNLVPWAGAFALDGASVAEVCVAWGPEALRARSAHELGERAVCTRLSPR